MHTSALPEVRLIVCALLRGARRRRVPGFARCENPGPPKHSNRLLGALHGFCCSTLSSFCECHGMQTVQAAQSCAPSLAEKTTLCASCKGRSIRIFLQQGLAPQALRACSITCTGLLRDPWHQSHQTSIPLCQPEPSNPADAISRLGRHQPRPQAALAPRTAGLPK